jgi:hypothetical protein
MEKKRSEQFWAYFSPRLAASKPWLPGSLGGPRPGGLLGTARRMGAHRAGHHAWANGEGSWVVLVRHGWWGECKHLGPGRYVSVINDNH